MNILGGKLKIGQDVTAAPEVSTGIQPTTLSDHNRRIL